MEEHGRQQVTATARANHITLTLPSSRVNEYLKQFRDVIDSPRIQLVVRNAILTLLDVGENPSKDKVGQFLWDEQYRAGVLRTLKDQTPEYWSEQWNTSWRKDAEPLLSAVQERISRQTSLFEFWTKEWSLIGTEAKLSLKKAFRD